MLTFIDVKRFKTSKTDEIPSTGHFSISDKGPQNRLFVSSLCHGDSITLDRANAQKMVDFLQKNVIDAPKTPEELLTEAFNVKVGDTVVSISPIDRFSDFLIEQEITGTVQLMNDTGDLMVKVDQIIPELAEWDNCLTYPNDGDKNGFWGAFNQEFKVVAPEVKKIYSIGL